MSNDMSITLTGGFILIPFMLIILAYALGTLKKPKEKLPTVDDMFGIFNKDAKLEEQDKIKYTNEIIADVYWNGYRKGLKREAIDSSDIYWNEELQKKIKEILIDNG